MSKLKYCTYFILFLYFFLGFSVKSIYAADLPGYSVTPAPICYLRLGIEVKSSTNIKEFNDQVGQIYADINMQYFKGTPPALWAIPSDTTYKTDGSILLGNKFQNYTGHKIGLKEKPDDNNKLYVTVKIHNDGMQGTWTLTKTPVSIKDSNGILLPMVLMGNDCGSTSTGPITYTWTPTEVLPVCSIDKPNMLSNESFTLTAKNLTKDSQYILTLNNILYDGIFKSNNEGKLVIENIQLEKSFNLFAGDLVVSLKPKAGELINCKPIVKVTNVAEPIAGDKCCNNSSYSYIESANQCSQFPAGLGIQTDSNCKQGDKCFENVCRTPVSVKYYRCDTPKQACTESIFEGKPNPNGATSDKDACDKSCIANGKTFASNAPAATPTSVPPPGGAGQLCYVSSGVSVPAVNLDYAQKHPTDIGILTAIGCVPTEPTQFILAVSKLATGMGGGIALLLMIVGAFKMITSAGNPDHVKEGSEQMTSAIIGLLFIIFAVLLLKVIGVDILNLPGFLSP